LEVLDEAVKSLGMSDSTLEDQRARVYFYHQEYPKALQIWDKVLPSWKKGLSLDPPFSMRWAGMAAAREVGWEQAFKWFKLGKVHTDTLHSVYRILNTGFKGDMAFSKWKAGEREEALRLFCEVLEDFKSLPDPRQDIKSLTLQKRIGHTISWIAQDAIGSHMKEFAEPSAGCMSNLETFEELREYPTLPAAFIWSLLSSAENAIGAELGIKQRFIQESSHLDSPVLASQRSWLVLEEIFRDGKLEELISTFVPITDRLGQDQDPYLKDIIGSTEKVPANETTHQPRDDALRSLLLAALLRAECSGGWDQTILDKWRKDAKKEGLLSTLMNHVLRSASEIIEQSTPDLVSIMTDASAVQERRLVAAIKLSVSTELSPSKLFYAHITVFDFFNNSSWRGLIEKEFEHEVVQTWSDIVTTESFSLLSPRLTIPAIQEACTVPQQGLNKVAKVLLAALDAVSLEVPAETRASLRKLAMEE